MKKTFKQDKGQAGLTILLSVIVMLFVIGLLIMIFSLMGSELQTSVYDTTTGTATNETLTTVTEKGENFAVAGYRSVSCATATQIWNGTTAVAVNSSIANQSGCRIWFIGNNVDYNNSNWRVTYSYTWKSNNTASDTMYDTIEGLSGTTDWFDIFVVITAMVVLILLTVIIVSAIRSSGMVGGMGATSGANSVGTA